MSRQRFRVLPTTYDQTRQDHQQREWGKWLLVTAFVLPGMILFLLFVLMPIAQSARVQWVQVGWLWPLD